MLLSSFQPAEPEPPKEGLKELSPKVIHEEVILLHDKTINPAFLNGGIGPQNPEVAVGDFVFRLDASANQPNSKDALSTLQTPTLEKDRFPPFDIDRAFTEKPRAFGFLPVDNTYVYRGYKLPAEDGSVLDPRQQKWSFNIGAANYINIAEGPHAQLEQKYETETLAIGFKRGLDFYSQNIEIGAILRAHYVGEGFLNGFIEQVETLVHRVNESRKTDFERGYRLKRDGVLVESDDQHAYGFGDLLLSLKTGLVEPSGNDSTALAARLALNIPTSQEKAFNGGRFAGIGASISQGIFDWLTAHGDVNAKFPLEREDIHGLALRPVSYGGTGGLEFHLSDSSSFITQLDASSSPYKKTGLDVFDQIGSGVTVGLAKRFQAMGHEVEFEIFGRQNLGGIPFPVEYNDGPDFVFGISINIR